MMTVCPKLCSSLSIAATSRSIDKWSYSMQLSHSKESDEDTGFLSFFCFLGLNPRHMEVPRLGVQSEL